MKIAIIVRKLSVGGTQRQALHLALQLRERGHGVTLYALRGDPDNVFADLIRQIPVVVLPERRRALDFTKKPLKWLPSFLLEQWKENRDARDLAGLIDPATELLNPHHDPAAYKTACYFKKKVRNIPSVWMMNDLTTKYGSFLRARELYEQKTLSFPARAGYTLFDWWERVRFIKAQDYIVVLDNRDRDWARAYMNKDAIVVRSGVDIGRFPFVKRDPPVSGHMCILMVGIFFTHRRFEDAIEALYALKEKSMRVTLTIVGDPRTDVLYADAIKDLVSKRGLRDIVSFLGRVDEEELNRCYRNHNIFLFPSHLQSWGLAVFEAMASGLPVIVSRTAGASEILTNEENALIVDPKSPDQIAGAVERLLNDTLLYEHLSVKGREFVERHVSWNQYAGEMEKCFRIALSCQK